MVSSGTLLQIAKAQVTNHEGYETHPDKNELGDELPPTLEHRLLKVQVAVLTQGLDRIILAIKRSVQKILQYMVTDDVVDELHKLEDICEELRQKQLHGTVVDPQLDFSELENND